MLLFSSRALLAVKNQSPITIETTTCMHRNSEPNTTLFSSPTWLVVWIDANSVEHGCHTPPKAKSYSLGLIIHNIHVWYWKSMLWSVDSCQNKVSADQYHVTISLAQVLSSSRAHGFFCCFFFLFCFVFFLRLTADQLLAFASEEWSSQLIFQFKQLERRSLKKSRLQRDSNPWPPRYRCDTLPTELWSHTLGARSIYWVHISREEWNDVNYIWNNSYIWTAVELLVFAWNMGSS